MWVLTGTIVGAGLSGALAYRPHRASMQSLAPDGAYCDSGIGAAKGSRGDRADQGRRFNPADG